MTDEIKTEVKNAEAALAAVNATSFAKGVASWSSVHMVVVAAASFALGLLVAYIMHRI
jgi:hypothetical protein